MHANGAAERRDMRRPHDGSERKSQSDRVAGAVSCCGRGSGCDGKLWQRDSDLRERVSPDRLNIAEGVLRFFAILMEEAF